MARSQAWQPATGRGVPSSEAATLGGGGSLVCYTECSQGNTAFKKGNVTCRFVNEVTIPLHLVLCYWYSLSGSTDRLNSLAHEREG